MALLSGKFTEHSRSKANNFCCSNSLSALHNNKFKCCSNTKQMAASKPKGCKYKWKFLSTNPKKAILHIHSLTKLYESIPDYMELSHLSGRDFYSTLATLRNSYRKLKDKELLFCKPRLDFVKITRSSDSLISPCTMIPYHNKRNLKHSDSEMKCQTITRRNAGNTQKICAVTPVCNCKQSREFGRNIKTNKLQQRSKLCVKNEIRTISSAVESLEIADTSSSKAMRKFSKELHRQPEKFHHSCISDRVTESLPLMQVKDKNATQKSLSSNNLNVIQKSDINTAQNAMDKKSNVIKSSSKESSATSSQSSNSIYRNTSSTFEQSKSKEGKDSNLLPEITANAVNASDSTETARVNTNENNGPLGTMKTKGKNQQKQKSVNAPFKIFNIETNEKSSNTAARCISAAVYPAARPNLAATLRFEYCKSKFAVLKEDLKQCSGLANWKCNKFDWEVRKSPAWKSLLFEESHKDILAIRLAARKAEQALQHREHQLDMELMRERVKSSPLLLEGTTFWTSSSNQNTQQQDKCGQAGISKPVITQYNKNNTNSLDTNKKSKSLNFNIKNLPNKTKHSHHYSSLKQKVKNSEEITKSEQADNDLRIDNESADELSSLDRALL